MAHGWSEDEQAIRRYLQRIRRRGAVGSHRLFRQGRALAQQQLHQLQQAEDAAENVAERVRENTAPRVHALRSRGRRAGRSYPAMLLVVMTCLLALLACDLSPSFLPLLSRGANGNETGPSSGVELPTPSHLPAQKPLTYAQRVQQTVDYTLSRMTLGQKIGQMMMFETTAQTWNNDMDQMVRQMGAGAIIIYKKNMVNPAQLKQFIATSQSHTTIPMFVTMDEEGGNVDRLGDLGFAPHLPSAQYLGSTGDPNKAYQAGVAAALELQKYGINTDLAPVVDVRLVPNQVEGPRLYGNDPATVEAYASGFLNGLQQNWIIGCLKHWPGIGSTVQDPHLTLPVIDRTVAQLESTEFAPFRDMLKDHPGMIMVTHVILSAIDPTMPSSLSPIIVNGILRNELGYNGVIITDNLWMQGVSSKYPLGQAAVLAVMAGDDLLEGAWNAYELKLMIDAVKQAVANGTISQNRINQSVRRLLTLKAQYGILPLLSPHHRPLPPGAASAPMGGPAIADLTNSFASAA